MAELCITINAFRADACCYQKDTLEYQESENGLRLIDALTDEPQ